MLDEQLPCSKPRGVYVQMPRALPPEQTTERLIYLARFTLGPLMVPTSPLLEAMYRTGARDEYQRIIKILTDGIESLTC